REEKNGYVRTRCALCREYSVSVFMVTRERIIYSRANQGQAAPMLASWEINKPTIFANCIHNLRLHTIPDPTNFHILYQLKSSRIVYRLVFTYYLSSIDFRVISPCGHIHRCHIVCFAHFIQDRDIVEDRRYSAEHKIPGGAYNPL